jgi:uncharacterized protein YqhQ
MAAQPVIGGQAVVEGVMMRSPKSFAVAVRTPDGAIVVREEAWLSFAERFPILRLPLLRGANMLVESLYNGLSALNFSASIAMPTEPVSKAGDDVNSTTRKSDTNAKPASLWPALAMSMLFALLLFKGVPHLTTWALGRYFGHDGVSALPATSPWFHLVDGGIKLAMFVGYIALITRLPEVKRLFMYHGAEHKSVHVYEAHEPLDVEHARTKSTAHPRCGTSLILLVIATSIFVFAAVLPFVPVVFGNDFAQSLFLLAVKIPLLPPIAGLAYEVQRLAARHPGNVVVRALIAPGMLMQRLTTREPGDRELEVALAALRKAVWREKQAVGDVIALPRAASLEVYPDFDTVVRQVA